MPSNQILISSPSLMVRLGSRIQPIPLGVPIWMIVPFSSVVPWLSHAIAFLHLKIMSLGGNQPCEKHGVRGLSRSVGLLDNLSR